MRNIYIFDVEELKYSARQDDLLAGLNLERREKIAGYRQESDRVRGLGAGLLLQYGIWKAAQPGGAVANRELSDTQELHDECNWIRVSLDTLERSADAASQFCSSLIFAKNAYGKPYLEKLPIHFNLSHSGSKVICGISDRAIGVDIQEMTEGNVEGIWKRFFDEREKRLLKECATEAQRRELFYRMWAWKEAYGKLTGQGIGGVLDFNTLESGAYELELYEWRIKRDC